MIENSRNNKKTVSGLLDRGFGKVLLYNEGIHGKVLHEAWNGFYDHIFKTANRGVKVNYRVFDPPPASSESVSKPNDDDEFHIKETQILIKRSFTKQEIIELTQNALKLLSLNNLKPFQLLSLIIKQLNLNSNIIKQ